MIRAAKKLNIVRTSACARKFSTNQPPKNTGATPSNTDANNNNAYLIGGGLAVASLVYFAYALETDAEFAKSMKDTPGISLMDPVRSGLVSMGVVKKDAEK